MDAIPVLKQLLAEVDSFTPARSFLRKFLIDDVSSLPPYANLGRIVNDINDERRVHAACVDSLYAPAFGDKQAKAIMSEVKVFEEVLGAFKSTFESHKTPESFKLAWPGVESSAKDFLAAVDTYHEHLRSWLPKVVDSLSPERRAGLIDAMKAKRAEIAASKLKGPDDIDLRALKKAAKLAEKARLAAEELENEGGAIASKKAAKKAAKKGEDGETAEAKPAAAGGEAAKPLKEKKAKAAAASDVPIKVAVPSGPSAASTPQMPMASPSKAAAAGGPADPSVLRI